MVEFILIANIAKFYIIYLESSLCVTKSPGCGTTERYGLLIISQQPTLGYYLVYKYAIAATPYNSPPCLPALL